MNNNFYTYAYLREDGTPYYIGKGRKNRIHSKIRSINLPPKERRIFLKQNLTEKEAFKHEIYMIAVFGRKDLETGILRNKTDGGEGISGRVFTEEQRKNIGATTKDKWKNGNFTDKTYEKWKNSALGEKNGMYEKTHTKDAKSRIIKRHYKLYEFISPSGEIIKEYTTILEFCRKYKLENSCLCDVVNGKAKHHKGWTLLKVSTAS